ncbi:Hypothetical protein CpCap5W_2212 [Corynebacterium pseudotuberculosis]|nr:Hypothetical protein Cp3995_2165 [Corynebacterium pseudotuberculosis 3/99-5]AFH53045.1 Hypothetical protein Cp267_2176 [Corynebacterium pseudotuberculosis 267]AIG10975.1 hypothetical protein CPTC_00687 [Corynebacterium pseudotuberculosis]AKC74876.1 Hypothetical protein Cp226_2195 [Corynebacterium pseudotuberculosis]AKP09682.1 Hypothetical protein Cp262_2062 [Corynebacterium pseudotuberculosis]
MIYSFPPQFSFSYYKTAIITFMQNLTSSAPCICVFAYIHSGFVGY